jgi:hypothetical protein
MPLERLTLMVTNVATSRDDDIYCLNRSIGPTSSYQQYKIIERRKYLRIRISEVLLGIRAPAAASTNWPSVVQSKLPHLSPPLLKFYEGGICHYQNGKKIRERNEE